MLIGEEYLKANKKSGKSAEVFVKTKVEAALAAGIFHRKKVPIADVKN